MMYRELEEEIHKWKHWLHSIIGSKLLQGLLHLHLFINLVFYMFFLFSEDNLKTWCVSLLQNVICGIIV